MGLSIVVALVALVTAFALSRRVRATRAAEARSLALGEVEGLTRAAVAEAAAERARAEVEARQAILTVESAAHEQASVAEERRRLKEAQLAAEALGLTVEEARLRERDSALELRHKALSESDRQRSVLDNERKKTVAEEIAALEQAAGERRIDVIDRLRNEWVDEARAEADERLRQIEAGANDAERGREAKRVMGIAIQRYAGHYLTERLMSNLQLAPGFADKLLGADRAYLPVIEELANIKLLVADDASSVRLDGQDSFGREIARSRHE